MEMIFCPNCKKLTGYKRVLGFGTFFAVLFTVGFWLLVLPFYPKRCITCGLSKSESVPWYRTWRLVLVVAVGVIAFGFLMDRSSPPEPSRPVVTVNGPEYERPASSTGASAAAPSDNPATQHEHAASEVVSKDSPEDHELREDGRIYSVALIVAASDISVGEKLLAQGRVESLAYASGMRSRPLAVIEDEQQAGKTLLCAMMEEEGTEVFSLYKQGEVVAVSGQYMGSASVAGYPSMPILSDCHVASPRENVVRPAPLPNIASTNQESSVQKKKYPPLLQLTIVGGETMNLPNGSYMLVASARLSDAMIREAKKKGMPPGIDKVRLELICGGSRPGCVPLLTDDTYWMQYLYPGDVGYYADKDSRLADCHPARFARELGEDATAVYYVCAKGSN